MGVAQHAQAVASEMDTCADGEDAPSQRLAGACAPATRSCRSDCTSQFLMCTDQLFLCFRKTEPIGLQINWALREGCFEIDLRDGEVRYRLTYPSGNGENFEENIKVLT